MRVLITGASGMVGRNLLDATPRSNHELLHPSRAELDLSDPLLVKTYLEAKRPDLVVHCAGRVGGIAANIRVPASFLVDNFDIGKNVLLACRDLGINRVVNVASSCMYPKDSSYLLEESMILQGPLEPTNEGYALAKISVMRLGAYLRQETSSFSCKTVIPCNLYGRYDRFDPEASHLVAAAIRKAHMAKVKRSDKIEVWGDGSARREFMYASDFAAFLWMTVERFDSLPEMLNVGPGVDYTIDEYYEACLEAVDWRATLVHDASRPVGMQRKLLSVGILKSWGWQPQVTLKDGIAATYKYFLQQHG